MISIFPAIDNKACKKKQTQIKILVNSFGKQVCHPPSFILHYSRQVNYFLPVAKDNVMESYRERNESAVNKFGLYFSNC